MKRCWILLLMSVCCSASCIAASKDGQFQQALELSRAGQFADAANSYRALAATNPATGTLVNLGLAEWRRGRVGPAMLAWEQAVWLSPGDHAARNNLDFAREVAQLEAPLLAWHETASLWLPPSAWAWIAGLSLWCAIGLATLPNILRRRKTGWQQALAALGLGIFLLSLPAHFGVASRAKLGIVLEKNALLRLTPTDDSETVLVLPAGESARLLKSRGKFVFVRTSRGMGWLEQKQFALVCPGR